MPVPCCGIELPADAKEAFWSLVDRRDPDECWPWTGNRNGAGYGRFSFAGRRVIASRAAWYFAHGTQPTLFVCHSCDNPPCCNPAHLWLGTSFDNLQDMAAKGRSPNQRKTHCKRGHEFTPENTLTKSKPGHVWRRCLVCRALLEGYQLRGRGRSQLSDDDVREIRRLRGGVSQRTLARRFGVAASTIHYAQRADTWPSIDQLREGVRK